MDRKEMIKTLLAANFAGRDVVTDEEVFEYAKYLRTKTDLELQNMLLINCF
jgi:hypothetical protein